MAANKSFSVWPKPDVANLEASNEEIVKEVIEDRLTQKEINLEVLRQLRLLNTRIEEAFCTQISDTDVKEGL